MGQVAEGRGSSRSRARDRRRKRNPTPPAAGGPVSASPRPIWIHLALAVLIFALYGQVAGHQFVRLDDWPYLLQNPHVRQGLSWEGVRWAFTTSYASNWHPLTWLSHMLDCEIFGLRPAGPHLVNVALHAANAILLFEALRRMTGAFWTAAFAAALFALHPLRVESVAWASERKDVLAALFWWLATLAYLGYARRGGLQRYLGVFLLMALGLMAKPMLVTLPFALLLLDFWPLERWSPAGPAFAPEASGSVAAKPAFAPASPGRLALEKTPLLILSVASALVTLWVQRSAGSIHSLEVIPTGARVANALVSYVSYLGKTIWPAGLACFYPHPAVIRTDPMAALLGPAIASGLLLAGITAAVLALRRHRYLPVGWFWYLGTLVPVIGLVQVGSQARADRYTYLPLVGIYLMIAWGARDLLRRRPALRSAAAGAAAISLAACALVTAFQVATWKDTTTLLRHALAVTRNNYLAHNNLGLEYTDEGRLDDSSAEFAAATKIRPNLAVAYYNWGVVDVRRGELGRAAERFETALRYDPDHAEAHNNLGRVYALLGRDREAIEQYRRALDSPDPPPITWRNLAWLLATTPDPDLADGREAVRLAERYAAAVATETWQSASTLAAACARAGDFDRAIQVERRALDLAPPERRGEEEARLETYRARRPFLQETTSPNASRAP